MLVHLFNNLRYSTFSALVDLPVFISFCLSVRPSVRLSVCLSVYPCLWIFLSLIPPLKKDLPLSKIVLVTLIYSFTVSPVKTLQNVVLRTKTFYILYVANKQWSQNFEMYLQTICRRFVNLSRTYVVLNYSIRASQIGQFCQ